MMIFTAVHRMISRVYAAIVDVKNLNGRDIDQMYGLMNNYYEGLKRDKFLIDLKKKDKVILLRDRRTKQLMGFSTLYVFSRKMFAGLANARNFTGVFSGDTIIHRDYWGGSALQLAFGVYLSWLKIKTPWRPVYWFLISKGYKTYLLMANNFPHHYPRFESIAFSDAPKVMDHVYSYLYPESWDSASGLIVNRHGEYHLKYGVAVPDKKLCEANPRVGYFVAQNPRWEQGDELACIAEMNISVLTNYIKKRIAKYFARISTDKSKAKEASYAAK